MQNNISRLLIFCVLKEMVYTEDQLNESVSDITV